MSQGTATEDKFSTRMRSLSYGEKNQYAISCSCPAVVVFVVVDLLSHGWCNLLFNLAFVVILIFW